LAVDFKEGYVSCGPEGDHKLTQKWVPGIYFSAAEWKILQEAEAAAKS
jgi:hypothetical protein